MERDNSYRLSCGMELLDKFGKVLPFCHGELRKAAVGKLVVPVMEIFPEKSVKEVVELEKAAGSVWEDFFGDTPEINRSGWM